jgi:hypothetical protein
LACRCQAATRSGPMTCPPSPEPVPREDAGRSPPDRRLRADRAACAFCRRTHLAGGAGGVTAAPQPGTSSGRVNANLQGRITGAPRHRGVVGPPPPPYAAPEGPPAGPARSAGVSR